MFFGTCFAGDNMAISNSSYGTEIITVIKLKDIIIDELYATRKVLLKFDWNIPNDWDFDTFLHALYNGSAHAGNVGYSELIVDKIKIKKRKKGDFDWKTIYEKEINTNADFQIEFYDYYDAAKQEYEYAYVAVISGVDSTAISSSVYSDFDSYFICDRDESYPMILETKNEITYNRESKTIVSLGNKYPYVVNNGIAQYYSGKMTVTFIEFNDETCQWDIEHGWQYRNQLDQFLADGQAKILKSFEGDMWMINVVGNIPRNIHDHYAHVSQEINWVECGDPTLVSDLYDNNFIDTDVDRE